ncbi:MAG: hypothetical protein Ct9H90mV3_310 [uncultured marine virus]|nr:MAG: hypothetical protein Ct9H90mV3_310 [uncultured marine virus]
MGNDHDLEASVMIRMRMMTMIMLRMMLNGPI